MTSFVDQYIETVIGLLKRINEEEQEALNQSAKLLADVIVDDQCIFAFGCTHSSMTMQDIFVRAGGLMLINPIFAPGLNCLDTVPFNISTQLERKSGYADIILNNHPIKKGDALIVVSVSGRNAMPIEMAKGAKERGLKVIAVTSREYSDSVASRHSSGKKMYEFADVVLDNKAVKGDALLEAEGMPQSFCPGSGVTSTAILQCMIAATIEELLSRGHTPPVFLAANVEGGDEYNQNLYEQYKERIFYM